jgi:ferredoxin
VVACGPESGPPDPSAIAAAAFQAGIQADGAVCGDAPLLGGELRQKAVWVDEASCIGCRYCANVATNTFVVEPDWGRSRAIRQDGDSSERIQEAIDTCPVDCIHWVPYEQLPALADELSRQEILPLGLPSPSRLRRTLPRASAPAP